MGHISTVDFTGYYNYPYFGLYSSYCGPLEYVLDSGDAETYLDYDDAFLLTLAPLNDGTHTDGT